MHIRKINKEIEKSIGINLEKNTPKYFQKDFSTLVSYSNIKGLEIMSIKDALEKYDWLKEYFWKALNKDKDEITKYSASHDFNGYFIRVEKNVKISLPIQACLYLEKEGLVQNVHNIIIAEENSEINVVTGCTIARYSFGKHIGISEFYLKKGAKVNFTMIHHWNENTEVMPRTAVILEENSTFISNYILLSPTKLVQTMPITYNGKNSKSILNSLILGLKDSFIDVGGQSILMGENSSSLIESRIVAKDSSKIISRGKIVSENKNTKGHIECRGLLISDKAEIQTIPELYSKNKDSELTHEASVGKIKKEEILYLMSRGFSEEESTKLIINGFLNPYSFELPKHLKSQIESIIKMSIGF